MHSVVVRRKFTFGERVGRATGRKGSSWGLFRGWWRMPYLPWTTSPFLIALPPWNTRFLLPYLHSSHLLCHRSEFWILLLWGTVFHQPSKLGPNMFVCLRCQVRASPLSHSGPLALKESQSSFQGANVACVMEHKLLWSALFYFPDKQRKNFIFQTLSLSTTLPCSPWSSIAHCLCDAFTSIDNFFNWPCEATLLQRKSQHWTEFSVISWLREGYHTCSW